MSTTEKALRSINMILAEEGAEFDFTYDFDALRNRFEDGYKESIKDGDPWVTIKIPSSVETVFKTLDVGLALLTN